MLNLPFFRRNPLKTMSTARLQKDEESLRRQFEKLSKEVEDLERQIQYNLDLAKSKLSMSRREEDLLTHRLKTLGDTATAKKQVSAEVQDRLRLVIKLRIIKEKEQDLKAAGVWKQLLGMPPETLESYLSEMKLDAEDRENALKDIIKFSKEALKVTVEPDESIDDIRIRKVIAAVREGSLEPDAAAKQVSKDPLQRE